MDFDIAAKRLQADQKSALAKSRASRNARAASAKAKKEAQAARAKAEKRLREKKLEAARNARIVDRVTRAVVLVERDLGVTNVAPRKANASSEAQTQTAAKTSSSPLGNVSLAGGWTFTATSIHGEGDKIALPPSVLESMTSSSSDLDPWGSGRNGRPIAFRIGVLNPEYTGFPSSEKMKVVVEGIEQEIISSEKNSLANQSSDVAEEMNDGPAMQDDVEDGHEDEDDHETDDVHVKEAYLDELSHRYLAYTHGTVLEFTQEDGCVGLPEPIARALLQQNAHSLVGNALAERGNSIPFTRTVDPAASSALGINGSDGNAKEGVDEMDVDTPKTAGVANDDVDDDDGSEKTPGHPAYGLFDVPALPIEVTPINSLPPGRNCTFTPTQSSIKNGFYALKDVKLVLEQSLMRTRATLSRGDIIRTWRRGVSFDLIVSSLSPPEYGAVSCVNTDLNVDIGPAEGEQDGEPKNEDIAEEAPPKATGGGRLLSEPASHAPSKEPKAPVSATVTEIELPPEPEEGAKEGVCNIQIRGRTQSGSSAAGRRRFDVRTATVRDLFNFASLTCGGTDPATFRLVTRFPRRVFTISSKDGGHFSADATLESAGLAQGQELFMVESV